MQIIRNGTQLKDLGELKYYDFSLQNAQVVPNTKLLRGDRLITTCGYDTLLEPTTVLGILC
jgi:hypothetical protein